MLSKRHACQLLQEQPLVHHVRVLELPPLESVRERVLQQEQELVQLQQVLELQVQQVLQVLELQQLVLVRDHHVQERLQGQRQAHYVNRANQPHEHRLRQGCHRGTLFSASIACSVR
jgi:hypothetical protein